MKKILLACSAGMSTSLVVQKMRKVAAEQGKDYKIWATSASQIVEDDEPFDVCLVGPQLGGQLEDIKYDVAEYGDNIPVAVIDKNDYGKMNAENILALAEKLLGE